MRVAPSGSPEALALGDDPHVPGRGLRGGASGRGKAPRLVQFGPEGGNGGGRCPAALLGKTGNDPSAGSPTETLLRLLLPLDSQV